MWKLVNISSTKSCQKQDIDRTPVNSLRITSFSVIDIFLCPKRLTTTNCSKNSSAPLKAIATLKLDPARVALLSWFVDSYLALNQIEEMEFQEKVDKIKPEQQKEQVMQMVTSWMEQGIEQGIEQGEERVALRMVQKLLLRRFGEVSSAVDQQLKRLSVQQLEELHDAAYDFSEVSDLLNWLDQNRPAE
jgi:Domain of unknown function (DUF4351)